jgi:amidase
MRTGGAPDADVSRVFAHAIDLLSSLGHFVEDGPLPFDGPAAIKALGDITEGVFARRLGVLCAQVGIEIAPDDLEFRSATLLTAGKRIGDDRFDAAWSKMQTIVASYLDRLNDIDVWMTPTFSTEIVRIGVFGPDTAWEVQKDHLIDYAGYCWIDNFAGSAAVSLPLGFSTGGLPVGVQFTARPGDEAVLLSLAYQLEEAVEWWRHIPPIWVGDRDG